MALPGRQTDTISTGAIGVGLAEKHRHIRFTAPVAARVPGRFSDVVGGVWRRFVFDRVVDRQVRFVAV